MTERMTEKIIKVIDAILARPEQIEEITQSSQEYYFKYKGHAMSIMRRSPGYSVEAPPLMGKYALYVYPSWRENLQTLATYLEHGEVENVPMVTYDSRDFDDEEPFRTLWHTVESKYLNVDMVLDDILSDRRA